MALTSIPAAGNLTVGRPVGSTDFATVSGAAEIVSGVEFGKLPDGRRVLRFILSESWLDEPPGLSATSHPTWHVYDASGLEMAPADSDRLYSADASGRRVPSGSEIGVVITDGSDISKVDIILQTKAVLVDELPTLSFGG